MFPGSRRCCGTPDAGNMAALDRGSNALISVTVKGASTRIFCQIKPSKAERLLDFFSLQQHFTSLRRARLTGSCAVGILA